MLDLALGIAVVVATLLGPVLAVMVTRKTDDQRRIKERQLDTFRSLMVTRRAPLSPEGVRALNMVEIEFYGVSNVERALSELMLHINTPVTTGAEWNGRKSKLLSRLLSEIAKSLGYKLQQLDALDGGYYPQGLVDIELEQQAVRKALLSALKGETPLAVKPFNPS